MDAIKLQQLQQSFAEKAKEVYNSHTKVKGIRAVGLYWDAEEGELCIRIMEDVIMGYTAQRVMESIQYAKENGLRPCIEIYSAGGNLYEAIAIYDYIKGEGISVKCDIYGYAMSAGSVIACACDYVSIGLNSIWMMHRAKGEAGTPRDLLDKANSGMENIYMAKSGLSRSEIAGLLDANDGGGTFLTADEAIGMGFVDKISGAGDTEIMAAIAAHFNFQFTNKTKEMSFIDNLKALFKVKADASEDEVLAAAKEAAEKAQLGEGDEQEKAAAVEAPAPAVDVEAITAKVTAEVNAAMKATTDELNRKLEELATIQAAMDKGKPTAGGAGLFTATQEIAEDTDKVFAAFLEKRKKK